MKMGQHRYARDDVSKYELKRLRRGVTCPIYFSRLTRNDATRSQARIWGNDRPLCKRRRRLSSVMHGIGRHILQAKSAALVSSTTLM